VVFCKGEFTLVRIMDDVIERGTKVTYGSGRDVGEISSDAGAVDDIVESELINEGGELEQKGQGLCANIR